MLRADRRVHSGKNAAAMTNTHGFLYVARDTSDSGLRNAEVGALVRTSAAPPWLVVNHEISTIGVASWPGRLLRVAIVDGADDLDLWYVRCRAVQLVEELAPARVFGPHGARVVEVIEVAQRLTLEQARRLADHASPDADEAYTAAWTAWIAGDGAGRSGAPIGDGFMVIRDELEQRARAVAGAAGLTIDADGGHDLHAPWNAAGSALLHAAMALGAPHLVAPEGRAHLLRGWYSIR
jgi:hypothetical protein